MTDIHHLLQVKNDKLLREYDTTKPEVTALLDTLHHHVLPHLVLELTLLDSDIAWLSEWFSDTTSTFRLLRRHKFTRSLALKDVFTISIWRIRVLRPALLLPIPTLFHCLPLPIADPLGHPVVFLKLAALQSFPCSIKDALLQEVECLRLHLRYIHDHMYPGAFPLQYLVIVDLDGISIQSFDLDLCSWLLTDVIPRYPGMLAAVFLLNYSWIYSSAWSVAKRMLPSSIIARIFFPSKAQLLGYCSAATLPAEYGGSLPPLDQIGNALRPPYSAQHPPQLPQLPSTDHHILNSPQNVAESPASAKLNVSSSFHLHRSPSTVTLSPFSPRNPFFGYPTTTSASSPYTVRHVRRGLRELLYTLAVLWWRRWGRWVRVWIYVGVCGVVLVLVQKMRHTRARVGNLTAKEMMKTIMDFKRAWITTT